MMGRESAWPVKSGSITRAILLLYSLQLGRDGWATSLQVLRQKGNFSRLGTFNAF